MDNNEIPSGGGETGGEPARAAWKADWAALRHKQLALAGETRQWRVGVDQYNADAAALNAEDAPIKAEDAALTAAVAKHNATFFLFKIWPLNGPYNAEAAALAARQAALNTRVVAHNLKKTILDSRALAIRGQEASINARALQYEQEASSLAHRAQDLPRFPQQQQINGTTEHGEIQVNTRDGHGVNDAFANPVKPPTYKPDEYGGSYRYVGKDATVCLNEDGKITTTWPNTRKGWRKP